MPHRARDMPEELAENLLARILVEAGERGLVPMPKPTGRPPAGTRPRVLSMAEQRRRKRLIREQALELESRGRTA